MQSSPRFHDSTGDACGRRSLKPRKEPPLWTRLERQPGERVWGDRCLLWGLRGGPPSPPTAGSCRPGTPGGPSHLHIDLGGNPCSLFLGFSGSFLPLCLFLQSGNLSPSFHQMSGSGRRGLLSSAGTSPLLSSRDDKEDLCPWQQRVGAPNPRTRLGAREPDSAGRGIWSSLLASLTLNHLPAFKH